MADVDKFPETEYTDLHLEGNISSAEASPQENGKQFDTLDEPIKDTILRDLKAVGMKFFHVFYPRKSKSLLREWDLWGPLILCVFLAMMLQGSHEVANSNVYGGPHFAEVFVIVWVGAIIVTINSQLLGGTLSFFQSVCVLGYCLLPPSIALIICRFILLAEQNLALFIVRFVVTMLAFCWATFASTVFLADNHPPNRKGLTIYPICLFYFVISWLIVSHTHYKSS